MKNKRKTKETISGRSSQLPSIDSSLTDLKQLDTNVSSRDGVRTPPLTSSKHRCFQLESSDNQKNPPQCGYKTIGLTDLTT